ncbi:MAG: cation:proton antiporter [Pseudomonadota bacterium]
MTDFLLLAFVFLIAGVVSVPIATRLGLGSVLGYLIAGILISPILALLNVDVISIQHFAEFGVVMMLFLVGLELEPKALWSMRTQLFGLGGGQIAITTVLVMAAALVLGESWSIALTIGLVLALSSTAIVLQTLNEKGLMRSDGGQSSFSVLLAQDIAVIPMLALLPLLALPELAGMAEGSGAHGSEAAHGAAPAVEHGEAATDDHGAGDGHDDHGDHGASFSLVDGLTGWQTALVNVAAIAVVILGGQYLTRPVFRFISAANLRELFTATALLMVIGIALLMTLVGLSAALGTFLAGVVLANSEYRHELESDIDPFRGLLLGLFFMTVGASIDFALLSESVVTILALTFGLMALKGLVLFGLGTIFGARGGDRWLMSLSLAQAGEFGFVLLSFTVANAVLPEPLADRLLLVVALSMLLTPVLFIVYDRVIAPRYSAAEEREADEIDTDAKIIIAGRGRVGGLVHRILEGAGHQSVVIDYSSRQIENLRTFGVKTYYGDATRPDLLHAAGIEEAKILVVAVDGKEQIDTIVRHVLHNHPQVHIIARAVNRHHVYDLWFMGCRDIIRETYDASLRMGRSAIEALGVDRERAEMMVQAFNEDDRQAMIDVADVYDPAVPATENDAYVDRVREILGPRVDRLRGRMEVIRDTGEDPGFDVAE